MSIRKSAIKGAGYTSAAVFTGRGFAFISQLVLGWILAPDDFATYALVVGVLGFTNALVHGGAHILMLQGADRINQVLPAGMRLATIFDIGIPLIIAALAWPIANAYDNAELAPMLWIIVASIPLRLLGLPYRMRAAAMGRFGDVSIADVCQNLAQHALVIIFAVVGFGPFAFVMGQPLVNLLDWLILRKRIGPAEKRTAPPDPLRTLLKPAGLVLVSALGISLAVGTTENLILGEFASELVLAYFFFGYRLASAINQVFGNGIRFVLVPSFAQLKSDPERMKAAGLKAFRTFDFFMMPVSFTLALLVGPIMHVLWQGKWDESIVVAFVLLLAAPTRLGLYLNRSFLEACGQWTTAAILVWVDGILLALVVFIAAPSNDLFTIAYAIGGYRAASGLAISLVTMKLYGIQVGRILPLLVVPILATIALVPALWFSGGYPGSNISFLDSLLSIGIFLGAYAVLVACFLRARTREAFSAMNIRRGS